MNWEIAIFGAILFHAFKNDLNEVWKTLVYRVARRFRRYRPTVQAKIVEVIEYVKGIIFMFTGK